jgi:AraC family transcriptional regulator
MQPQIVLATEKHLVGQRRLMSLLANTTAELWRGFMQRCKAQPFPSGSARYSVQRYDPAYFRVFHPEATFEKWAAVEVAPTSAPPADLEVLVLPGGLYAVFQYRGPASGGPGVFRYIMQEWLPASAYVLDERPHFEVLGEKYQNEGPHSEEEIWIPIKLKLPTLAATGG